MSTRSIIKEQVGIVICIYAIVFICQIIAKGTNPIDILKGMMVSLLIVIPAIIIKNVVTKPNLPGFAWSTLLAALLTLPISPVQPLISELVGKIDFMVTVIPLLAFAGISIGDKLPQLKKMSWKIALVALVVMSSTYFGSALIAQLVLGYNDII